MGLYVQSHAEYTLDWDLGRQLVLREISEEERLFTSPQLADYSLKVFLDKAMNLSEDVEGTRLN